VFTQTTLDPEGRPIRDPGSAVWIWNLADQHVPGAIQIVDLYHARQHL
jgi:hypothetical protein